MYAYHTHRPVCPLRTWGGKLRAVPQDFKIPQCSVRLAFQLWVLGDEQQQYPPFRTLKPSDMGDDKDPEQKNKRRQLSDLKALMSVMEVVRHSGCQITLSLCAESEKRGRVA